MPSWFDGEVAELERRTRTLRGQPEGVVFCGSSSFTLWHDMAAWFPAYNVVNHGFGGATLGDCVEYFDRLVAAMQPRAVVLYAGDNDLGDGAAPETVLQRLCSFVRRKRETLGTVPMAFVSIKISPARFHLMHRIAYTNRIIEGELAGEGDVEFVDNTRRMVGRGLIPLLSLYTHDPLHMNREGYRILAKSLTEYLEGVGRRTGPLAVRTPAVPPAWMDPDEDEEAACAA